MIIETLANEFFEVTKTNDINLAHVYFGQKMKKTKNGFIAVKKIKIELVRIEGTRQVA